MWGASKLALVLCHAVYVGIDLLPVASLNLCYQAWKHVVNVFLVLRVNIVGQLFVGCMPRDGLVGIDMRKYA